MQDLKCPNCDKTYKNNKNGERWMKAHMLKCLPIEDKNKSTEEEVSSTETEVLSTEEVVSSIQLKETSTNDNVVGKLQVPDWLKRAFDRFSMNGEIKTKEKPLLKEIYLEKIKDKLPGNENCKYTWITIILALKQKIN